MSAATLPLFPLRLVLFPDIPQLLHVFEPRYRQLLKDCLAGDRTFGLPLLQEGSHSPEPGDVGSTALIKTASTLPDGRSNILVEGGQRFVIQAVDADAQPYFLGSIQTFHDEPFTEDDKALAQKVWNHLAHLRATLGLGASNETLPEDPTRASFRIASHLDLDPDVAEEMLRLTSCRRRLQALDDVIQRRDDRARRHLEEINRHRTNGKGSHSLPDIEPSG